MNLSRRDLCVLLPGLFSPGVVPLEAADEQTEVLPSKTYQFGELTPHKNNSAEIRPILKGKLATGESIEVHETTLPPGGAPHPPHHHVHSEMWLIREGTVELTIEGKSRKLGPGSLGIVKSNEEHGIHNAESVPATYFVVAVGPGAGSV